MQVSVETIGNIDRKMTVVVPADRVDNEIEKRLNLLAKRVRIDGFRPGKVPLSIVRQRYTESTRQEVIGDVLESTFQEAIREQNLRIAGTPSVDEISTNVGEPLNYTASFQVYPEFVLADVSGLAVTRPTAEVTEADLDRTMEDIRKQQKTWVVVERAAQNADLVRIDFAGSINGKIFDGGEAEDFTVELGLGRMLPEIEAALVGMSAGEEKVIDITFPEDYHAEDMKGQIAQFKLRVNTVEEAELPEINEDFITRFGLEDNSMEAFRRELKKNMERELGNVIKDKVKKQVMDGLASLHEIDIPKALVDSEAQYVREDFKQEMGVSVDNFPDDLFVPQASRRVKLGLVVGEIVRQHNIQRDQARVDALLESMAVSYEDPAALLHYYRNNKEAMRSIEAAAMEELIVEWVLNQVTVTEEQGSYDEIMGRNKPPSADEENATEEQQSA